MGIEYRLEELKRDIRNRKAPTMSLSKRLSPHSAVCYVDVEDDEGEHPEGQDRPLSLHHQLFSSLS